MIPTERRLSLAFQIKTVQQSARLMHAGGAVDYNILEVHTSSSLFMATYERCNKCWIQNDDKIHPFLSGLVLVSFTDTCKTKCDLKNVQLLVVDVGC